VRGAKDGFRQAIDKQLSRHNEPGNLVIDAIARFFLDR
jgi:hypothetical protein